MNKKTLWLVVYDNGYGRPEMAVVKAHNVKQARAEARQSWWESMGSEKEYEDADLVVVNMKHLKDGWIY